MTCPCRCCWTDDKPRSSVIRSAVQSRRMATSWGSRATAVAPRAGRQAPEPPAGARPDHGVERRAGGGAYVTGEGGEHAQLAIENSRSPARSRTPLSELDHRLRRAPPDDHLEWPWRVRAVLGRVAATSSTCVQPDLRTMNTLGAPAPDAIARSLSPCVRLPQRGSGRNHVQPARLRAGGCSSRHGRPAVRPVVIRGQPTWVRPASVGAAPRTRPCACLLGLHPARPAAALDLVGDIRAGLRPVVEQTPRALSRRMPMCGRLLAAEPCHGADQSGDLTWAAGTSTVLYVPVEEIGRRATRRTTRVSDDGRRSLRAVAQYDPTERVALLAPASPRRLPSDLGVRRRWRVPMPVGKRFPHGTDAVPRRD